MSRSDNFLDPSGSESSSSDVVRNFVNNEQESFSVLVANSDGAPAGVKVDGT